MSDQEEIEAYVKLSDDIDRWEKVQAEWLASWFGHIFGGDGDRISVIDLGCNNGIYLKPFQEGDNYCVGVDYIPPPTGGKYLTGERSRYVQADLRNPYVDVNFYNRGIHLYDLCICLEVCEHLEQKYHETLIRSCCLVSDTILFSCATPGQGGTFHKGERPTEQILSLFRFYGFGLHPQHEKLRADLQTLRPKVEDGSVSGWLVDNALLLRRLPK